MTNRTNNWASKWDQKPNNWFYLKERNFNNKIYNLNLNMLVNRFTEKTTESNKSYNKNIKIT